MVNKKIKVCLVGLGHWGPNFVRAINAHPEAAVVVAAEQSAERRAFIAGKLPDLATRGSFAECLAQDEFDAVVIATPTEHHHRIAVDALNAGKHVFVEKPLAHNVDAARHLVELAEKQKRILMTGHVFLFNTAVTEMKRILDAGEIGQVLYLRSVRTNLGPIRQDVNALWDLAAHDISIFNYLYNDFPVEASCTTFSVLGLKQQDIAQASLTYHNGRVGVLFVSWLDPQKKREFTVVGDKKMLVFDDMNPTRPLKVFDKGVKLAAPFQYADDFHTFRLGIREGAVTELDCSTGEPLRAECAHFIDSIISGNTPLSDGQLGLDIVTILAALSISAAQGGKSVNVHR